MKRIISIILAALLLAGCLSGCGGRTPVSTDQNGKKKIVVTIFPAYDWILQVLGEQAGEWDVKLLLDNGVDLHSYQPTAADILEISTCDLFVYVGGESDNWVKDVLKNASNKEMQVISLMEVLEDAVREEELVEGMEAHHEEQEEEEPEYDEHVWLSLRNAGEVCDRLAQTLSDMDPENRAVYENNEAGYRKELTKMDASYRTLVEQAGRHTILFGDRFPFRYLAEDYGLEYYAAFLGCSAETEAGFDTIVFLAGKVDELKLPVIFTMEGGSTKIAETIRDNTAEKNQEILVLDSMQAVSREDLQQGITYLDIMEKNLEALGTALR